MLKRIKSSIFLKTFLSIFLILMLASLSIYGIVMVATPGRYKAEIDERFSENTSQLVRLLKQSKRKEADKIIVDYCIENQTAVVLQGGGRKYKFGKETEQNRSGGYRASQRLVLPIHFTDDKTAYAMEIVQSAKVINEMTLTFLRLLPWIFFIIFVVSAVGSFFCSRILARPILKISRISKRMSELDMTWSCDINRTDELGMLANSLNTMAQKLDTAMTELETANQKLQADIQKERAQERQRKTFFAAVSHELKTPVTILRGQIESMILGIGDYKNKEKYLPLALESVERMENLVQEILTVSRLTSDDFRLSKSQVDLSRLIRECLHAYQPLALKKEILFECGGLENVTLSADKKLLEKVLSNILSNAVLYSPAGEKVKVALTQETLEVVNTGAYIPEKKLPELFAPLTRVEESRSKQSGGSGLGLYIVKTILDLHGFSCDIQNADNGVCFRICF